MFERFPLKKLSITATESRSGITLPHFLKAACKTAVPFASNCALMYSVISAVLWSR
jgi:hypothetical protein